MTDTGKRSFEQAQHDLALRYGVDLPELRKPKLELPAFFVGSCARMLFSPSGDYLFVKTNSGCFLWDVLRGVKLLRFEGAVQNPWEFAFSPDGSELLMRNEQSEFARFAIPSGELLVKFKAQYGMARLDGSGCFGPDRRTVLQLAHGGMFLLLDANDGKILHQRQLEKTGVAGEVYWLPDRGEVIVAQSSHVNRLNVAAPCALWRWRWPLTEHDPQRLPREWVGLNTGMSGDRCKLLLHHRRDAHHEDEFIIDVATLDTLMVERSFACGGSALPFPSLSHDGAAWAVSAGDTIQVGISDERLELPVRAGQVQFHPTRDLVAVTGEMGFVMLRAQLAAMIPLLQKCDDERELTQRGYARATRLPGNQAIAYHRLCAARSVFVSIRTLGWTPISSVGARCRSIRIG
ncbi:hypothetical protein [Rudaea sp.]|uniref:hypothetical protein n=1 Tax=Rudaea sp. TaxID=2136325 RepID=UPI002ED47372